PGGHGAKPSRGERSRTEPKSRCWYSAPAIRSAQPPLYTTYSTPNPTYQPSLCWPPLLSNCVPFAFTNRVFTLVMAQPPSPYSSQSPQAQPRRPPAVRKPLCWIWHEMVKLFGATQPAPEAHRSLA